MQGTVIAAGLAAAVVVGLVGTELLGTTQLRDAASATGTRLFSGATLSGVELHGFPKVVQAIRNGSDEVDYSGSTEDGAASIYAVASDVDFDLGTASSVQYILTLRDFAPDATPIATADGRWSDEFTLGGRQYRTSATRHGNTLQVVANPAGAATTAAVDGDTAPGALGPATVRLPDLPRDAVVSPSFATPSGVKVTIVVRNARTRA